MDLDAGDAQPALDSRAEFPDTEWFLILSPATEAGDLAMEAQERLCRAYLAPVYSYFRVALRLPVQDAEDLALAFIGRLGSLVAHLAARETPKEVRFRDFLRRCARNFASGYLERATAKKRGGGCDCISFEEHAAVIEENGGFESAFREAELIFDREWASTLVARAKSALASDYDRRGEGTEYSAYVDFLIVPPPDGSHAELAARWGMTPAASRKKLERLRSRFRLHLRGLVARTLRDPSETDTELRYLIRVWFANGSGMSEANPLPVGQPHHEGFPELKGAA
jgi:RNA polymerase sigma-70 factor (ECF subfamily)